MNYTELKTNIEDITENTFTDDQLAMFTEQAEQKIYNTVQIPALRKNVTGTLTASNKYLATPADYLYTYSLAVVDGSGNYHFLLNKDVILFVKRIQYRLLQDYLSTTLTLMMIALLWDQLLIAGIQWSFTTGITLSQ